jgi:hypothetical protein
VGFLIFPAIPALLVALIALLILRFYFKHRLAPLVSIGVFFAVWAMLVAFVPPPDF